MTGKTDQRSDSCKCRDSGNGLVAVHEFFEIGGDQLKSVARGLPSFGAETLRVAPSDDQESVILVDTGNDVVGSCGKISAHREGRLHRAFSILIANTDGELLLQKRAAHKYHFANRWSNACCGHPRPGESTPAAAHRRLIEELGFSVPLTQVAEFSYFARDPVSDLVEHEYLHVYYGLYAGELSPNPDEVVDHCWIQPDCLQCGLASHPDQFTPWFTLMAANDQAEELRTVIYSGCMHSKSF